MFKLLVTLFIIKTYGRNKMFKRNARMFHKFFKYF